MKKHVILINTSRGEIVNTADLVEALKAKTIFGAALDVFEGEKMFIFKNCAEKGFKELPDLQALTGMTNVIISSHVAFYTDESIRQVFFSFKASFTKLVKILFKYVLVTNSMVSFI
jgi:D-lactate dehydrogenase